MSTFKKPEEFVKFIDEYEGELLVRGNKAYDKEKLIAKITTD